MNAKRASVILGVFMAVVLLGSTFLQLISRTSTTTQTVVPTVTAAPTFPPPPSASDLDFSQLYLHPTGIFAIAQPTGFDQASPNATPMTAQVNLVNNASLSVIDAFVQDPGRSITTADLSGFFTQESLDATWDFFSNWSESSRVPSENDLTIDFAVTLNQQQYVARQRAWTDGAWVYSVRVLTPANATDYLQTLLEGAVSSMIGFNQFAGTPLNWTALYDYTTNGIIRYPSDWQLSDGGAGRPTSITSPDGAVLRVETRPGQTVDSNEAATAVLQQVRPNAAVALVAEISQPATATSQATSGYRLTFTSATPDGEIQSGIAELLNGPDDTLYVAVLRAPVAGLEQTSAEATQDPSAPSSFVEYQQIMSTFGVLIPLTLSPSSLPPTATPTPTPLPVTPSDTPEPTATNTATATATDTPAPTATNTATNTPEPTATDTPEPTATNTREPTATNTATATATDTPAPTATNTARPTRTPRPTVTP